MKIKFENFGNIESGRVVTQYKNNSKNNYVVFHRNPYGSHNLILVCEDEENGGMYSWKHGTENVKKELSSRTLARVLGFLSNTRQKEKLTKAFQRRQFLRKTLSSEAIKYAFDNNYKYEGI